jgi:hypothetical protein
MPQRTAVQAFLCLTRGLRQGAFLPSATRGGTASDRETPSGPPPVPDGQRWAAYLLSPGFGGTAAFFAAAITGGIAWRNSAKDRNQRELAEQRSQWWDRFTWATEKAIDPATSTVGSKVLDALVVPSLATAEDARMAIEISEIIDPPAPNEAEGGE